MVNAAELFRDARDEPVRIALVGAGQFGATLAGQAPRLPGVGIAAVCDVDGEKAARLAPEGAAVLTDALEVAGVDADVVVEATGHPETAAALAEACIAAGKHVVMATKEAEVAVGPMLARLAAEAGVVYTLADGDQPSLLVGLVARARLLGLEVVVAGKSGEHDLVWTPDEGRLTHLTGDRPDYPAADFGALWQGDRETVRRRTAAVPGAPLRTPSDLTEMAVVANHTGLGFEAPDLLAPIARWPELPDLFRPHEAGGLLRRTGVVDMVTCLRRPDEASLAGGVFVVVRCDHAETWAVLAGKGIPVSGCGGYAALVNPVHLLGLEAMASILQAVRLGLPTGAAAPEPRVDLAARATRHLGPGHDLAMGGHHHEIDGVEPLLVEAGPIGDDQPLPFTMAANTRLAAAVAPGTLLTADMVEQPADSALWRLRRRQDALFRTAAGSTS
ncbi:MAG: flagellar biosynthesis protein FlgA [Proteobacteria bacterium]|nr:flagellar biosynthesis protein FlgA [Pseudomonadota bacterium]